MVKIAIVGPSEEKWNEEEQKKKAKGYIFKLLLERPEYLQADLIVVSGHCPKGGIDIYAEEVAKDLDIPMEIFKPEVNQWNDKVLDDLHGGKFVTYGYKSRNIKIAETCDILYCIVPESSHKGMVGGLTYQESDYCYHCLQFGHIKSGGCWTMKYAKKLGKETHLVVIE